MRTVLLTQHYTLFNPGETAGFSDSEAAAIVGRNFGVYADEVDSLTPDAPPSPLVISVTGGTALVDGVEVSFDVVDGHVLVNGEPIKLDENGEAKLPDGSTIVITDLELGVGEKIGDAEPPTGDEIELPVEPSLDAKLDAAHAPAGSTVDGVVIEKPKGRR